MATKKTTTTDNTAEVLGTPSRNQLALNAAWEIEALCLTLRESNGGVWMAENLAGRGITLRIEQLSRSIMDAIGDDVVSDEELRDKIIGAPISFGH